MQINHSASRLESISDAIFGFAATLVVVSLDVPKDFGDLKNNLGNIFSFGVSFLGLILIWKVHYNFFRRTKIVDNWVVGLNMILMFFVLLFVYPLKFLANLSIGQGSIKNLEEIGELFQLYSLGFTLIFLFVSLMYRHASKIKDDDENGRMMSYYCRHFFIFVAVGALSILIAKLQLGLKFGLPGFMYALLGPLCYWHGKKYGV